jgi:Carboxypeptidase regulatory-like domain
MLMSQKPVLRLSLILTTLTFALSLALSRPAAAQDVASLTGVVSDTSGAVVVDAAVKLVDTKTNTTYNAKTNSSGAYLFTQLVPGPGYKLIVTKEGFDSVSISNLYLAVNTTHTQNAQLRVGKTSETVEVIGAGSSVSLNTTDATVGNNLDMNMVHELPVQLRDSPAALLSYQPGVTTASTDDDPNQSRNGAITGARTDQTNITLDGLDVNDFAGGFAFYVVGNAPVDSVQEFRGEVANPVSAEGRGSGGQISLVTKSGSNHFHGSAYEYYRTRGFEANDFFNKFTTGTAVPRPPLVRNQFGADLGGPIWKDKLFFFFNYEGRRDARGVPTTQTVPLDSFKQGNIAYINNNGGVSVLPATATGSSPSVQNFDPLGIGASPALTAFLTSRYPRANSTAVGDGLNTGGLVFNAPGNETLNDYVARLDLNLTSKMKVFARGSLVRETDDRTIETGAPSIQFPGDPLTFIDTNHSYAYVLGHTWTISNTKVNDFRYGETRQELNFPFLYKPLGTTTFTFDAVGTGGAYLSPPYLTPASQGRTIPIPVYRDDFTYVRGKHTLQFGGTFKPIKTTSYLISDFNNATLGLGGGLTSLGSSLEPSDLATDPVSTNLYDSAFAFILGHYASVSSSYNNNRLLQPFPQGTGHRRSYRYYETEVYAQDTWRVRDDFTLSYGLRYQFDSVPYEVNGLEAIPNIGFDQAIQPRIASGTAGQSGFFQNPIITYSLGGKANHAPPLFQPDWHAFQPRLAFAYNPSGVDGWLGRVLGDRKTVIRGGAAIIDDHTLFNALNFLQDQNTWILQSQAATAYGVSGNASTDLQVDPRFTSINALPAGSVQPPPAITTPFSPAFVNGNPWGLASFSGLAFNYAIDPHLKTPYSETISLGFQRELRGGFQLDATYVGRFAHRLDAQADAMQTVNFVDPASGTDLASQFAQLSLAVRNNQPIPTLPFFENQMNPTMVANPNVGGTCEQIPNSPTTTFPNCASLVAAVAGPLVPRGDLADTLQALNGVAASPGGLGLIAPGVGLNPQFGTSLYITNKGYSNYNGLLATLHKKMSHGLQFDLNYTWSHSLDNISAPANEAFGSNGAGGIMCDAINTGVCYGNSDFDIQHAITADWVYELPFGRGRTFGGSMSRWADEVVGGWSVSGLMSWRTGLAFQSVANAYPISFANNVPAVFNGDTSALRVNTHQEINAATGLPTIQLFKNQTAALGAFSGPLGLQAGSRNNLRGPRYSNFDLGLMKHFPITEQLKMEFRADAFNAFNHTNFELPGSSGTADITSPSTFGVITSDYGPNSGGYRVMQLALRLDF